MKSRPEVLLGLLADGSLHSGATLAAEMQVSRAAIWKMVGELRDLGVDVESLPRRGYRLPAASNCSTRRKSAPRPGSRERRCRPIWRSCSKRTRPTST